MKTIALLLVPALFACSSAETDGKSSGAGKDVQLSLARLGSSPAGPAVDFRGTFQGTEPCLYFQNSRRAKIPVAFVGEVRWDPGSKGVVASDAAGTSRTLRPGEQIIVQGWEVESEALGQAWQEAPPAECGGERTLVIRRVTHNFPDAGTAPSPSKGSNREASAG